MPCHGSITAGNKNYKYFFRAGIEPSSREFHCLKAKFKNTTCLLTDDESIRRNS